MLHQKLGDELFFRSIREYNRRFAYQNVTTADFQAVVEELSGQDLDGFFQQWVAGPANPRLSLSWTDLGEEVIVQVCQLQEGVTFSTPLEIGFQGADGETYQEELLIDERQERVALAIPFDPTRLEVDPGQKILADAQAVKVEAVSDCGK
jgi:aminopeptidase N